MNRKILCNILTKEMLEYEYKQYGSLTKVAKALNISVDSVSKYVKLFNINYNMGRRPTYSCDHNFFKNDSQESFYWAGFMAADGSLQKRKNTKIIKLTLSSKDLLHLEKFKLALNSNNPIKQYLVKPSKIVKNSCYCCEMQIISKTIFDDLNRFNIVPNKTKIYDMPDWLTNHPMANHFMRGYFDGDGTITTCGLAKNRKILQGSFSILGNQEFIIKYKQLLMRAAAVNDVKIEERKLKNNKIYKLSYAGNANIRKIYNFLYNGTKIHLDRKQVKMKQFTF